MMYFPDQEISKLDQAIQTSLTYVEEEYREDFSSELKRLRDEKDFLERKIKGYLTLSDICNEYKEKVETLKIEYNKLLRRVNSRSPSMQAEMHTSESPMPGNDPGPYNGHDFAQLTQNDDPRNRENGRQSPKNGSIANEILHSHTDKRPIKTQELFDVVESAPKSSEGHKSIPFTSNLHEISRYTHRDSFPMQESICQESGIDDLELTTRSLTGLGFSNVACRDSRSGLDVTKPISASGTDDLMNFSLADINSIPGTQTENADNGDVDKLLRSISTTQSFDDKETIDNVRKTLQHLQNMTKTLGDSNSRCKQANGILIQRMKTCEEEKRKAGEDSKRLLERIRTLERDIYQLSNQSVETSASQQNAWVHVQKSDAVQNPSSDDVSVQLSVLQQKNKQLSEANQRWSSQWNSLQQHFNDRIKELERERDRLDKDKTDLKLAEDSKLRDYEKMLLQAKDNKEKQESAKEEAYLQLMTANNRADSLQIQVAELNEKVSRYERDIHTLETEISVVRRAGSAASARTTSKTELTNENEVLRQQLLVFQEDFERERQDRAKAQSSKDEYKKQAEHLKKRVRQADQKIASLERQLATSEEMTQKLQQENDHYRQQNTELTNKVIHERNQAQLWAQQGPVMVPESQRHMVYGQVVQNPPPAARPLQYIVPQQYEQQRVPHITNNVYSNQSPTGATPSPLFNMQMQENANGPQAPMYNSPGNAGPQLMQGQQPYVRGKLPNKQAEYLAGAWSCNQCTYINYPGRTVCEVCGYINSPSTNGAFGYRPSAADSYYPRGEQHQKSPVNPPQPMQPPPHPPPSQARYLASPVEMYNKTPNEGDDLVMDANKQPYVM